MLAIRFDEQRDWWVPSWVFERLFLSALSNGHLDPSLEEWQYVAFANGGLAMFMEDPAVMRELIVGLRAGALAELVQFGEADPWTRDGSYRLSLEKLLAATSPSPAEAEIDRARLARSTRAMEGIWSAGGGRFLLTERIRAGSSDEVRTGYTHANPAERVIATLTALHPSRVNAPLPPDHLAGTSFDGQLYAGVLEPRRGVPYIDVLVERLPPGEPAIGRAPVADGSLRRIGAELAAQVATAHAKGIRVGGICPELLYVDADLAYTGLVPRGPAFIASAPQPVHGPRSYRTPYAPFEELILGAPGLPADVFAICATLFFLGTGRHPFGDAADASALLRRITAGVPDAYPGDAALAALLARGLARDPAARPTAAELAAALV